MAIKKQGPLRVAILTNIVPRYRTPVFSKLDDDDRFQLKFFVSLPPDFSDPQAREVLDLQHTKAINFRLGTHTHTKGVVQKEKMPIPLGLLVDLVKHRPDIIISGDMGVRSLVGLLIARLFRIPLIIWTEETLEHDIIVSGLQKRLRRFLMPRADGFLAWGKSASNYLLANGISEDRITYCAQAVNNEEWSNRAARADSEKLRRDLKVSGRICLAVGRLIPRKGFKEMIEAFGALPPHVRKKHSLVLVGDGPEYQSLARQANDLGIEHFFMVGSKSPEELALFYKAADFLIFPSLTDVWGLVVNEAMACGTPVISSIHAGVTEELVNDTGIGESFDPNDRQNFTEILTRWLESPPEIDEVGPLLAVSGLNFSVTVSAISGLLQKYLRGNGGGS